MTPSDGDAVDGTTSPGTATEPIATSAADADDTTPGADDSTTATADLDADACLQWCLAAEARDCDEFVVGETCYARCLVRLGYADEDVCGAEYREALACEAMAGPPAEFFCESAECAEPYKRHDLCLGSCTHLGAIAGGGGTQTSCSWSGSSCYGHDFEVECPVADAQGLCDCIVDEQVIAQCEVGEVLTQFVCGGDGQGVFAGCCRDAFEEVLLP